MTGSPTEGNRVRPGIDLGLNASGTLSARLAELGVDVVTNHRRQALIDVRIVD